MFVQPVDLTSALRPVLLPDETLLFVQDAIGLYQGQYKVTGQQNGQAYLTTHRVCYVDVLETRKNSVALELKAVEKIEYYAGFLKASPKITLFPKATRDISTGRSASHLGTPGSPFSVPARSSNPSVTPSRSSTPSAAPATWVCPICGFPNALPSSFDATTAGVHTDLPACSTCGVKPPLALILKVAIANASGRNESIPSIDASSKIANSTLRDAVHGLQTTYHDGSNALPEWSVSETVLGEPAQSPKASNQCPKCTFANHPSMLTCELCGTKLPHADRVPESQKYDGIPRQDSPESTLQDTKTLDANSSEPIKLSFRAGGSQVFYEKLKTALDQRKWLLHNAPPIPKPSSRSPNPSNGIQPPEPRKQVGIASLELSRETQRKANELTLTTSFADLSALMASAKDILALAESFAASSNTSSEAKSADTLLQESAAALGMVTTRNLLGRSLSNSSGADAPGSELYISELARSLAELLTDDSPPGGGILKREGGIMSTIDLWAVVNRSRGGLETITPAEFAAATRTWEKLNLPVRLRKFKNGVSVVQRRDWTDEKTVGMLLAWLAELHHPLDHDHPHSNHNNNSNRAEQLSEISAYHSYWGHPISPHSTALHFGWSLGVATEELQMAEEEGALCREETVEGVVYWENWILWGENGDEEKAEWIITQKQTQQEEEEEEEESENVKVIEENLRNVGIL